MRDELLDLLARLVADGLLTEEAARKMLARFDTGEPMPWDMPIAPQVGGVRGLDNAAALAAIAALWAVLSPRRPSASGPHPGYVNAVQSFFDAQAEVHANRLTLRQISLAEWQREMAAEIERSLVQQMMAASGRADLNARQRQRVDALLREQTAYLSRFADQIALRQAQGQPFGAEYLTRRSMLYGGVGRGLFYEESEIAALEDGTLGPGWLVHYVSMDDQGTCSNCLSAEQEGPYLPGTPHPQPGVVCLGRAACRCRIEWRYEPERYRMMVR